MGLVSYCRIVHAITIKPATSNDVASQFKRGEQRIRQLLKRMVHMDLAHVTDWVPNGNGRGMMLPVFAGGHGVSKPYPAATTRDVTGEALKRSDVRTELMGFKLLLDVMREPVTRNDIQAELQMSQSNLRPLLAVMRDLGMCHIAHWERNPEKDTGRWAAAFVLGTGADARKPRALTRTEICRINRDRRRAKFGGLSRAFTKRSANDEAQQVAA